MIRVAAVADVHAGLDSRGTIRPHLERLGEHADMLLFAGDLTKSGAAEEAAVLADEVRGLPVPVVAVLGNHDYHLEAEKAVRLALEDADVCVLESDSVVCDVDGVRVGIAGTKGFGGGFLGACATDFGEPEMKAFVGHTKDLSHQLEDLLRALRCDVRIALMHYSPVEATLHGERLEIYPFLGSYLLAEAIDRAGADLVLHGHAHRGSEKGVTPGGVHVRNVALPVIRHVYNVYCLNGADGTGDPGRCE